MMKNKSNWSPVGANNHLPLQLVHPENAVPGDAVSVDGIERAPKAKITIKDFDKIALTVTKGVVTYGGKGLSTAKGPVTATAPNGATVK